MQSSQGGPVHSLQGSVHSLHGPVHSLQGPVHSLQGPVHSFTGSCAHFTGWGEFVFYFAVRLFVSLPSIMQDHDACQMNHAVILAGLSLKS